jgi:GTP-binding protein
VKLHAEFIASAARPEQFPAQSLPEVAFLGRSNVGKSSLLNRLVKRDGLAFISSRPGCTQTVNFFRLEDRLMLVDLPGYGFSRVPAHVAREWTDTIEFYLRERQTLELSILLLDARRGWMQSDLEMRDWLEHYGRRYLVVATKVDKLNQKEKSRNLAQIAAQCPGRPALGFSAVSGQGVKEIWQAIRDIPKRQV